jgi:hypothetical protein
MNQIFYKKLWITVFDGDEDAALVTDLETQLSKISDANSPEYKKTSKLLTAAKLNLDVKAGKLHTQERVNTILAEDRRKHQTLLQRTLDELESLKTKATLSSEEREELEQRIQATQATLKTKEETAAQEREKLLKNHKKEIDAVSMDRDTWKKRYTESTIETSILSAASGSSPKAVNPNQILTLLRPHTRLVEELGEDGKPTGKYVSKVSFADKDKNGKPIVLDLNPGDAIKRMSEMEEHLNLFSAEGNPGFGRYRTVKGKDLDTRTLARDPEAYRKARKEGLIK